MEGLDLHLPEVDTTRDFVCVTYPYTTQGGERGRASVLVDRARPEAISFAHVGPGDPAQLSPHVTQSARALIAHVFAG